MENIVKTPEKGCPPDGKHVKTCGACPAPWVRMEKTCAPECVDKAEIFCVRYVLMNAGSGENPPAFTKAAILDPLFTMTKYARITSATNICGQIDTKKGVATVDLTCVGGLIKPGDTVTVTVHFETAGCVPKDPCQFETLATAGFFAPPDTMLCAAASCAAKFQNGDLSIEKTLLNKGCLFSEQTAVYKIRIENVGNVESVIPEGGFNDCPPLDKLTDITLTAGSGEIIFDGTRIYNVSRLILSPKEVINVEFSARIL